jgi:hypothetical protein
MFLLSNSVALLAIDTSSAQQLRVLKQTNEQTEKNQMLQLKPE